MVEKRLHNLPDNVIEYVLTFMTRGQLDYYHRKYQSPYYKRIAPYMANKLYRYLIMAGGPLRRPSYSAMRYKAKRYVGKRKYRF